MNVPDYSAHSEYSGDPIFGVGYSVTPGTPAGYYIAAVIPEWSKDCSKAVVTPDSIIGVNHRTTCQPRDGKPRMKRHDGDCPDCPDTRRRNSSFPSMLVMPRLADDLELLMKPCFTR